QFNPDPTAYGNRIYFAAGSSASAQLYAYDPVAKALSGPIFNIGNVPFSTGPDFTVANNVLYFTNSTAQYGSELWAYDGVNEYRVSDINPGTASANPSNLFNF